MNREEEFDLDLTGTTDDFDETAPHAAYAGRDAAHHTEAHHGSARDAQTEDRAGEAPALRLPAGAATVRAARVGTGSPGGPLPWLALGAALILTGVLAAPAPPGEQVGIMASVAAPQEEWHVDIGFEPEAHLSGLPDHPSLRLSDSALIYLVSNQVQAIDLDDGGELWSLDGSNLQCHLTDPVILCANGTGADAELVRLHTTDGELERTHRPGLLAALAVDSDMITVRDEADATVVSREDRQGRDLWSHQLPGERSWTDGDPLATWLHIAGDKLLVGILGELGGRGAILTADTGAAEGIEGLVLVYRDVRSSPSPWLASTTDGELYPIDADGDLGEPLPLRAAMRVDDDPDSSLVFTITNSGLAAHSRDDGEEIWGWEEFPQPFSLARMGEMLIVHTIDGVVGLDLQTGIEQWRRPTVSAGPLYGDGETLVQVEYDNDTPRLVGIDSRAGTETFTSPLIGFTPFATAVAEGQLALLGENGLTLLTW